MLAAVTAHNGPPMVAASEPVTCNSDTHRRPCGPQSGSHATSAQRAPGSPLSQRPEH